MLQLHSQTGFYCCNGTELRFPCCVFIIFVFDIFQHYSVQKKCFSSPLGSSHSIFLAETGVSTMSEVVWAEKKSCLKPLLLWAVTSSLSHCKQLLDSLKRRKFSVLILPVIFPLFNLNIQFSRYNMMIVKMRN